jgi:amino acid adenylation domain-containing protein
LPAPDGPRCLHRRLDETGRRLAERPGVVDAGGQLTIGELRDRALRVAGALKALGLTPGDRVVLVADKSADAVTALYGILMAGGIYVPVPPSWPPERVEATIESCGAAVVLAVARGEETLTAVARATGRAVGWADLLDTPPAGGPGGTEDPAAPALILFTSGSTGTPKGVTLSHAAVEAFVAWTRDAFGIGPDDRIVCPSALNFDLSTLDVFNVALSGAACIVLPDSALLLPRLATRLMREAGATIVYTVPSVLVQLLEEGGFARQPIASLRTVLFAGEVMPAPWAARLRDAYPSAELWNLYGPTETNVVTAHRLPGRVDPEVPVPIGRPCPYSTVVLDPASVEQRDGMAVGELLVGGRSLMTRYWGMPAETAGALVTLPGADVVFYRTGDRVSAAPDGTLSFVGRMDRQVKRRGVRIELGEIEAVLAAAPGVAEAAAVAEASGESCRILAFAAPREGQALEAAALRAHCARQLPTYMMPDAIRLLARLPRGSRGKVDYESLARESRRSG